MDSFWSLWLHVGGGAEEAERVGGGMRNALEVWLETQEGRRGV